MSDEFPFNHFLKKDSSIKSPPLTQPLKNEYFKDTFNSHAPDKVYTEHIVESRNEEIFSPEELKTLSDSLLTFIQSTITPEKYNAYFTGVFQIANISIDTIKFYVAKPFIKTVIESHYLELIKQSILNTLGKEYRINIELKEEQNQNTEFRPELKYNKVKSVSDTSFTLDLTPNKKDLASTAESQYMEHIKPTDQGTSIIIDPDKRFENFIVGPSNSLASAASQAICTNPGKKGKYQSLYIHSGSGLGKTHLLHAVANGIREAYPNYVICLVTAREFMKEFIESVRNKTLPDFQRKYSQLVDVLMLDDIHELKDKSGTQDELFHIFNELHNRGKQLIFTSDKKPEEINGIEERIRSRLQWGLVVDIQKPDLETRIAILKKKSCELDLYITDDVLALIASSIKTNIRELEGALIKLLAYVEVLKMEIDTKMVKDFLQLEDTAQDKKITLEAIAKATSNHFAISVADIQSKTRQQKVVTARFVAMFLSRKVANATQEEVGRFYKRDHSSVVHAEKKISERIQKEPSLSRDIMTIENSL